MRLFDVGNVIAKYFHWSAVKLGEPDTFCFHCQCRRHMRDTVETTQTNGRRRVSGRCSVCDHKMTRLLRRAVD